MIRGELNMRGLIDMPLELQAQYDNLTVQNDHPEYAIRLKVIRRCCQEK